MSALTKMNFTQAKASVARICSVGLVPMISGKPGEGKSSLVAEIAADYNMELITYSVAQGKPEDFNGLPFRAEDGLADFMPFRVFPIAGTPLPPGKDGWLLQLDEFNAGLKSLQAASYRLVLDRMVGNHHLHENVFIVATGNRVEDNAVVIPLSTALQSRLIHIELETDPDETISYMIKKKFDSRVVGFLELDKTRINNFNPQHSEKTFACSRTWEFVSRIIDGMDTSEITMPLLAGAIGEGMAAKFFTFIQDFGKIPSYASIVKDPKGTVVAFEAGPRYATIAMIMSSMQMTDMDQIMQYIGRMPVDMQVLFSRGALKRMPKLRHHPDFVQLTAAITKFMESPDDDTLAA